MATTQMNGFLRRLTRGMAAEMLGELTDRQLMERLLASKDEVVFEALVRRHGPMVYRVCWRVLHHQEDAEDAFQATFLVLARKLRTVKKRDSLASWLHGVAHRIALSSKAQAFRRRQRETRPVDSRSVPPDDIAWSELRTVLDSELGQLPEKWRLPLILCYLEGRSQEEAARQLGWSRNTLLRRLEEARQALGRRLTRRGVVWPAALSAVLVSDCITSAALPTGLIGSTVEAAAGIAAGHALTGVVSTNVTALTEGMVKAMITSKMKSVVAAVVVGALVSGGLGLFTEAFSGGVGQPALAAAQPAQAPKPEPEKKVPPGTATPRPLGVKEVAARKPVVVREDAQVYGVKWTADGKVVAGISQSVNVVEVKDSEGNAKNLLEGRSLVKLWDATTGKLMKSLGEEKGTHLDSVVFSPDKKHVAIMGDVGRDAERGEAAFRRFVKILDAETFAIKQELDDDHLLGVNLVAFSPDGKTLALGGGSPRAEKGSVVKLWDLEGKKMTTTAKFSAEPLANAVPILEKEPEWWHVVSLAFSSDGKILVAGEFLRGGKKARIQLYDVKTGEPKRSWEIGESKGMVDVAFMADGKRLVSASGTVKLWEVETGKELTTLETEGQEVFRFGPETAEGHLLKDKTVEIYRVAVSPDGENVATSGIRKEKDKSTHEVRVWSAKSGGLTQIVRWENPSMWASSIAFSRDGNLAIGAQTDADVRVKGSEKVKGELQVISLSR